MRVNLFLLADYANISEEKKLNVMGIFSEIYSAKFPARHSSMYVVLSMTPELGEFGETRQLSVRLYDPEGNELINMSAQVQLPMPMHGRKPTINAIYNLRDIFFPKPGPYQFVVLVDRDHKAELSVNVNQVEMQKPQDQQGSQGG